MLEQLIGLTLDQATELISEHDVIVETQRDGKTRGITSDYNLARIRVATSNGKITHVFGRG